MSSTISISICRAGLDVIEQFGNRPLVAPGYRRRSRTRDISVSIIVIVALGEAPLQLLAHLAPAAERAVAVVLLRRGRLGVGRQRGRHVFSRHIDGGRRGGGGGVYMIKRDASPRVDQGGRLQLRGGWDG